MKNTKSIRAITRAALAIAMAVTMTCVLSGCRDSDALKEILYKQTAEEVDYDNPTKFYVNDSSATEEVDWLPSLETVDNASTTTEVQNLVVYSSEPNTEGLTAKQSLFSKYPTYKGLEPSKGLSFYYDTSADAIDHEVEHEDEQEEEQEETPDDQPIETSSISHAATGSNGNGGKGDTPSDNGEASTKDDPEGAADDPTPDEDEDIRVSDEIYSTRAHLASADKIAATGQYAVLVEMIGGTNCLVATDEDTLNDTGITSVFSSANTDHNITGAVQGWSGSGSWDDIDIDAIINSGAGAVLCDLDSSTTEQSNRLKEAGISITVLPELNCTTNILECADQIRYILKSAGVTTADSRYTTYRDFMNTVIGNCKNANGNTYATGYAGTIYEDQGSDGGSAANTSAKYTLLIDGWDPNGTCIAADYSGILSTPGLAVAPVGYSDTPVSYYMQCGGVINRGAAVTQYSGNTMSSHWIVSQFAVSYLNIFRQQNWSSSLYYLTNSSTVTGFWGYSLLSTGSGAQYGTTQNYNSFGSTDFPNIIVTSDSMKSSIIENSTKTAALYHPLATLTLSTGQDTSTPATIGAQGNADEGTVSQVLSNQIPESSVLVNPRGLTGSWIEGSVEGFLEAAWVCDEVNSDDNDSVDWLTELKSFYSTCYGCTLTESQIADIENGED